MRDVDLERLVCGPRRSPAPDVLDQAVARDDAVGVEQKNGEQRPLFRRADVDRATIVENLQRSQDSKLHRAWR